MMPPIVGEALVPDQGIKDATMAVLERQFEQLYPARDLARRARYLMVEVEDLLERAASERTCSECASRRSIVLAGVRQWLSDAKGGGL